MTKEDLEKENEQLVKYCKELEAGFLNYKKNYKTKRQQVYEMEIKIKSLEKENEQLKQQIKLYKEMLNRNPCVKIPDWHCNDCLEENKQLKAQIEKMKCCFNCDKPIKHLDCGDCHNGSNWELAQSEQLIRS